MNREYRDNEIDFTNKLTEITKEGGWKLWDFNETEINKLVCFTADESYIDYSNKGGSLYFVNIRCNQDHDFYKSWHNPNPNGECHPDRLVLGDKNFMGRDENGKIVIGEHPKKDFADRNPNFVKIQIAQAVIAMRDRNLGNFWFSGTAKIKPKFYEMVSEEVGEMPVQIASAYAPDYL